MRQPTIYDMYAVPHLDILVCMEVIADRLQCPLQPLNGLFIQLVNGAVELLGNFEGCHILHGLAALSAQPEGFGVLPIVLGPSAGCTTMCQQLHSHIGLTALGLSAGRNRLWLQISCCNSGKACVYVRREQIFLQHVKT